MANPDTSRYDHGRSWFVLLGAFITMACSLGNSAMLSTLNKNITERVKSTSGEIASTMSIIVLFALITALNFMGGLVATVLLPHLGYKITIALGASLAAAGFGLSSLATHVWHLYLTLGLLTGIGLGLTYTPANGVLSYYFSRKLFGLVGSVSSAGLPAGILAYSYIHPTLISKLTWRSAMLVEAALCTLLFASAVAIREADVWPIKKRSTEADENLKKLKFGFLHQIVNALGAPHQQKSRSKPLDSIKKRKADKKRQLSLTLSTPVAPKPHKSAMKRLSVQPSTPENVSFYRTKPTDRLHELNNIPDDRLEFERPPLHKRKVTLITDRQTNDDVRAVVAAAPPADVVPSTPRAQSKVFPAELYHNTMFYMLLFEVTGMLSMSFFFFLTPTYLIHTHGWSSTVSIGYILTIYGAASLGSRVVFSILNYVFKNRIPIAPQIALGLVLLASSTIVFLCAPAAPKIMGEQHQLSTVSFIREPNAILFGIFAAVSGIGGTLYCVYQVPLLYEVVPKHCLTAAFACQNLVLGVLTLALSPVPILLSTAFGSLRGGYSICLAFCTISMVALIAVVLMIRRKAKEGKNIHSSLRRLSFRQSKQPADETLAADGQNVILFAKNRIINRNKCDVEA